MADLLVDGGADALWKALVVERRRDTAQTNGFLVNNSVDFTGAHSGMELLSHQVQYCNVDFAALSNSFNLLRCFNHRMGRDDMSLSAVVVEYFIKFHVAMFIFFLAAAPARVVAAQFLFRHLSSSLCILLS